MLRHRRYSGTLLTQCAFRWVAVFVVVLLFFVNTGKPAAAADGFPPNTVEAFRQFLTNDMDRLGKLVDQKQRAEQKLNEMREESKEQTEFYQRLVPALQAQINKEKMLATERMAVLERQLTSAAVTAGVLRLRAWEAPDTRAGLNELDGGKLHPRIVEKFAAEVNRLVSNGAPQDQAALAVMLGEDAVFARSLKNEGMLYLTALEQQIPQMVKLSQSQGQGNRIVREKAAVALAQLRAPAKDLAAAVKGLLDKDGSDVAARRQAFRALVLPFEVAAPRTLANSPTAMQYTPGDFTVYTNETRKLLDEQAPVFLPFLVRGLKDSDRDVRQASINALRDIASIMLVPLQPPPRLSKDAFDFGIRLRPMIDVLKRSQPLVEQLTDNASALIEAAADPEPSIRLQALAMLNDLAECRNRIRGWREHIEGVPPSPPGPAKAPAEEAATQQRPNAPPVLQEPSAKADKKSTFAVSAVREAAQAKPDDKQAIGGRLTPALKLSLNVLAKNLSDPIRDIRLAALDVLEALGPDANAPETLPALIKALNDPDKFVRWNTIRIFNRFGPIEPRRVVPALVAILKTQDGDGDVAKILGPTISAYGADAAPAVPNLIKAITVGEPDARIAFMQTFTFIGADAAPALPTVITVLKDHNPHLRQAAAETLGAFGRLAAKAEPDLAALIDDENPEVRKAVSEALLRIRAR
jgi:HEAT repeat protein